MDGRFFSSHREKVLDQFEVNWHQARRLAIFVAIVASLCIFLGNIFYVLLAPFFVGVFVAYLIEPLVVKLERRRLSRGWASLIMVMLALAVLAFAAIAIVPEIYRQVAELVSLIPSVAKNLYEKWLPLLKEMALRSHYIDEQALDRSISEFNVLAQVTSPVRQAIGGIWRNTPRLLQGVVDLILVPVFTFFFLAEWPYIRRAFIHLTPIDLRNPMTVVADKFDDTFRALIKGQATVAGIMGVMYAIGLTALGLESGLAIGVVAGLFRFIPYADVVVGGGLSAIVLLSNFQGMGQVIGVIIVFSVVQMTDAVLLTPRVIGHRVGLHPLLVIGSVIAFGDLMGFYGILIAIPVVALIKVAIDLLLPFYFVSAAFDPASAAIASVTGGRSLSLGGASNASDPVNDQNE